MSERYTWSAFAVDAAVAIGIIALIAAILFVEGGCIGKIPLGIATGNEQQAGGDATQDVSAVKAALDLAASVTTVLSQQVMAQMAVVQNAAIAASNQTTQTAGRDVGLSGWNLFWIVTAGVASIYFPWKVIDRVWLAKRNGTAHENLPVRTDDRTARR